MQVNNKIYDAKLLNQSTAQLTDIKLSVISHLLSSAYLIHIYKEDDQMSIYVMYQIASENIFRLVCNLGSLLCGEGQEYTIYIPKWDLPSIESYDMTNIFFPIFATYNEKPFPPDFFTHYIRDAQNIEVLRRETPNNDEDGSASVTQGTKNLMLSFFYRDIANARFLLYNSRLSTANYQFLIKPSTLEEQIYFMTRLPSRLQIALRLYSHNGDVLLNAYLRRNRQITPVMQKYYDQHVQSFQNYWKEIGAPNQKNLQTLLEEFDSDMRQLFYSAPPLTQNMKVYRGITEIQHFNGTFLNLYKNVGYISTSFDVNIALAFSKNKYMSIVYLKEGTRILYNIYSKYIHEREIIIPDGSYFLITKEFQPQDYYIVSNTKTVQTNECILLAD